MLTRNRVLLLISGVAAAALSTMLSCADTPTGSDSRGSGSAEVTVAIGRIGTLAKTQDIQLENLILEFTASGEDTVRDTIVLSPTSTQAVHTVDGLTAPTDWSVQATSLDEQDSVVHNGSTTFTTVPADTVDVSLDLASNFSHLRVAFCALPDSVDRVAVVVNGDTVCDSVGSAPGDTVRLAFDYLPATSGGTDNDISLLAFGQYWDYDGVLYQADTTLSTVSGDDASHNMLLMWVGPNAAPEGAVTMTVSLGVTGTTNINGIFQPAVPTDGLVAYYPFYGNAMDLSGNGNDGTPEGGPTLVADRFGNPSWAYSFDGVDDYIRLDDLGDIDDASVSAWLWFENPGYFFGANNTGNRMFQFSVGSDSALYYLVSVGTGNGEAGHMNDVLPKGEWHHVVITRTGGDILYYLDGQVQPVTLTIDQGLSGTISVGTYFAIGAAYGSAGPEIYFDGSIDDVRVYDRVLAAQEVAALYSEGGWTGQPVDVDLNSGLVAHYPMDGSADDISPTANHGTLEGAVAAEDRFGVTDKALDFDGVDDRIVCPSNAALAFGQGSFAVSVWAKKSTYLSHPTYLSTAFVGRITHDSQNDTGWAVVYREAGVTNFRYVQKDTYQYALAGYDADGCDGLWHHYVGIRHATDSIDLYVDGVLRDRQPGNGADTDIAQPLRIGFDRMWHVSTGFEDVYVEATIDDIRIYNRVLSMNEIDSLYHEGGWTGN